MAYTNIDDPSAYFQAAIYSGSNSQQAITNDGNSDLKPDWLWIKQRSSTENHMLVDSTRGVSKYLLSSSNIAEQTVTSRVETLDTDGFTVNGASNPVNALGGTYVGWQWKCNGGTTSSNTDGTVTSTVQVNQDAGFSIVTWTTGVGSGNHSVGHGLGVKPAMFITKSRGSTSSWWTWHQGLSGDTRYVNLSATSASAGISNIWGDGITSSVFGYNYPTTVYANQPYIAYCFAEKQGYSKFGKYIGNGNANGSFIYTGFKPAFLMIKDTGAAGNWFITDHKRNPFNLTDDWLVANGSGAETNYLNASSVDYLSNGFKLRTSYSETNTNARKYIYMAFAENPFTTSTGIPTTAR